MADEAHLEILRQGVGVWNEWRRQNRTVQPDLSGADLKGMDLREADMRAASLEMADLSGADLIQTDLRGANLRQADLITARLLLADLSGANLMLADLSNSALTGAHLLLADLTAASLLLTDLTGADMTGADLSGADLRGANLTGTCLLGVNLQEANLGGVNFRGANLSRADLSGAVLGWNIFGASDLRDTYGLDRAHHLGPSTIGIDALYSSGGCLPEAFLRGAGIPQEIAAGVLSLMAQVQPQRPCFLAHTIEDSEFAARLQADLTNRRIPCWLYPYDRYGGRPWRAPVSEAMRSYDRLLLVCSRHSAWSSGLGREVIEAIELQEKTGLPALYTLRLDDSIWENEAQEAAEQQVDSGDASRNWLCSLKGCPSVDFIRWQAPDRYDAALKELIRVME
ncbi:MAG: toll/interleukin-1 receptor domain-containing protein [Armatimonadetes bacterium]|nr:toll/interleukin-1 receptor domain-containing protein [Armatimonadota bacterium]